MKKLLLTLLLSAPLSLAAAPVWRAVDIPILPKGATLGPLWAGFSGDLYLWAETQGGPTKDVPTAHLLHWNGKRWRMVFDLPGHAPAAVFGVNESNVFAAVNKCRAGRAAGCDGPAPRDRGARIFRSTDRGVTWTPQSLPTATEGLPVRSLGGSYENVQASLDGSHLLRFDGVAWSLIFKAEGGSPTATTPFTLLGSDEGYLASGNGWGRWINGAWKFMPTEFGFREARGVWGIRDRRGDLRLYAVDSHRFSNGVRIWKFNPPAEDFELEFEEESAEDWGEVEGIWGSAEDDIYAIGRIGSEENAGRVYHFNGTAWRRETSMGDIPPPRGIHGTSRNDVWVTLSDGRLLHYSTATALTRQMSDPSTSND